ncbi:hypothetical protein D9X30_5100 [Cupriavidus sp. U2]|uniref:glycoside hydrolase family 19 protein n=1 Tax=Cupriavidus sp. U2 TaxID=2920269 RepID=UPI0020C1606F|nr:hypothetical protein [Cupriavidus sp. U2]KAI3589517.1 hypothetical protein D9X30_5100 [Cupriavidus sp. U2]
MDFQPIEGAHDPAHTLCAKSKAYVDYACDKDMPATAALDKLSPLMKSVYQAICPGSNGDRAIDELCVAAKDRWQSLRASRLIIRHESEWANPSKWKSLTAELEKETGANAQYAAEQRRIEKLVWWEEVKAKLPDLPGPAVFHMHPVGMVGNFQAKHPLITIEMLAAANPSGSTTYHESLLAHLNTFAEKYNVTTPKRIAHFLSQIEAESKFRNVEENLFYNSQNMKVIFGCKPKPRGASAPAATISENDVECNYGKLRPKLWSETDFYENNPENLANYVYENRYENGAESTGDGYRYRGRGLIQTTFKANYRVLTEEHNRRFPDDPQDFVAHPDLILTNLAYGIESAFVYWTVTRNINPIADTGDVATVSRFVNGGTHGIAARRASYNRLALLLDLSSDPGQ